MREFTLLNVCRMAAMLGFALLTTNLTRLFSRSAIARVVQPERAQRDADAGDAEDDRQWRRHQVGEEADQ